MKTHRAMLLAWGVAAVALLATPTAEAAGFTRCAINGRDPAGVPFGAQNRLVVRKVTCAAAYQAATGFLESADGANFVTSASRGSRVSFQSGSGRQPYRWTCTAVPPFDPSHPVWIPLSCETGSARMSFRWNMDRYETRSCPDLVVAISLGGRSWKAEGVATSFNTTCGKADSLINSVDSSGVQQLQKTGRHSYHFAADSAQWACNDDYRDADGQAYDGYDYLWNCVSRTSDPNGTEIYWTDQFKSSPVAR